MTRSFAWLCGSVVLAVLGSAGTAQAQLSLPDGWLATQVNPRRQHCDQHEVRAETDRILVACGGAGVWVVVYSAGAPLLGSTYDFPGEAVGFLTAADGSTWVKLQVLDARPLASGTSVAAAPTSAPPALPQRDASFPEADEAPIVALPPATATPVDASPPAKSSAHHAAIGKVIKVLPGAAVISIGSEDGIERSQHIELSLDTPESEIDQFVLRDTLAVGVVTNVTEHSAKVRLGVNEDVPVGARASKTLANVTASLSGPPRASDIWQVSVMARPFAALSELGGGALLGLDMGRRTKHLHVSAAFEPLGFVIVSDKPGAVAANGVLSLAYDSQYFEMGLGLGAQTVNDPLRGTDSGSGLTLTQLIRIGALDGTSFTARTNVALFHQELMFGGMVAEARFHVTRGYWLQLGGGGGAVGYGYGEIGLRALLNGNGLAGSTYLTVTAGGAGVFKKGSCATLFDPCTAPVSYGGPMAGLGGEWRF